MTVRPINITHTRIVECRDPRLASVKPLTLEIGSVADPGVTSIAILVSDATYNWLILDDGIYVCVTRYVIGCLPYRTYAGEILVSLRGGPSSCDDFLYVYCRVTMDTVTRLSPEMLKVLHGQETN